MSQEPKEKRTRQSRVLTFAIVAVTALLVIALTIAWLFQSKGLQTMTKIQFQYLNLLGKEADTISVELGEIDVRNAGEKRIPFCVKASLEDAFILQLGHTTNLPLTYQIIEVDANWSNWQSATSTVVSGKYLNKADTGIAGQTYHSQTYNNYETVQKNAEPLYWQSEKISRGDKTTNRHNFVLIVSWKAMNENIIDKDTDMIYLTAGIPGGSDETKEN